MNVGSESNGCNNLAMFQDVAPVGLGGCSVVVGWSGTGGYTISRVDQEHQILFGSNIVDVDVLIHCRPGPSHSVVVINHVVDLLRFLGWQ